MSEWRQPMQIEALIGAPGAGTNCHLDRAVPDCPLCGILAIPTQAHSTLATLPRRKQPAMASSLEVNKFLAAILTAGVIASGSGVLSRILYQPHVPEEPAYQVVALEEGPVADAVQAETVPLAVLLANASAEQGQGVVRACAACHVFEEGGAARIGPPLYGVMGRDIAAVDGFAYSPALAGLEGVWDYEHMDAFLADPRGYAPGTKMAYAGLRDPQARAHAIMYLRSLSHDPLPLPEPPAEQEQAAAQPAAEAAAEAATEGEQMAAVQPAEPAEGTAEGTDAAAAPEPEATGLPALLAQADVAAGQKATRVCAACHNFEEGGPNKLGPGLWGVVGRDIASHEGFSYSAALTQKEGVWDYEALDHFLASPREWAPGTKMAFAGVRKPEDRAAIILYLRSLAADPAPLPEGG
jgi:cytochrome c